MKTISWDSIPKSAAASTRKTRAYLDARAMAIRYIGVARKTSGRVRDKLQKADVAAEVVAQVLTDLTTDGYIDDAACGRAILAARAQKGLESAAMLRARLLRLGVEPAIAESVLAENSFAVRVDDLVAFLQARYGKQITGSDGQQPAERRKWAGRMARFLASRGFSGGLAAEAVYRVLGTAAGDWLDGD